MSGDDRPEWEDAFFERFAEYGNKGSIKRVVDSLQIDGWDVKAHQVYKRKATDLDFRERLADALAAPMSEVEEKYMDQMREGRIPSHAARALANFHNSGDPYKDAPIEMKVTHEAHLIQGEFRKRFQAQSREMFGGTPDLIEGEAEETEDASPPPAT